MSSNLAKSVSTMCVTSARQSDAGTIFFHVITLDNHLSGSQALELHYLQKEVDGDRWNVCFATSELQSVYERETQSLIVPDFCTHITSAIPANVSEEKFVMVLKTLGVRHFRLDLFMLTDDLSEHAIGLEYPEENHVQVKSAIRALNLIFK